MSRITFSPYALEQMRERRLSSRAVRATVANPDQVLTGKGRRAIAQRRIQEAGKDYLLRVVYEASEERIIVVTAYKTSKIGKYWRQQ